MHLRLPLSRSRTTLFAGVGPWCARDSTVHEQRALDCVSNGSLGSWIFSVCLGDGSRGSLGSSIFLDVLNDGTRGSSIL